ncbi:MAG TPA: farnesyl diphosphate synthase [Vicinamibacterales bacterium]|nr:farnesyl diphosphate synthase [Vicinamibacterales bacterium]
MTDDAGGHDDVGAYLARLKIEVDASLARTLDALGAPSPLDAALHHALLGGGKRLRPCLTLAAAEAIGQATGVALDEARALALPASCAVEMIHSYSLVHDDLPALDDDALRRGRPTTHVVFGDGLAVLAGDGLLTEAFRVLTASPAPGAQPGAPVATAARRLAAAARLAEAAGVAGMVGGQAIDLGAAGRVRGQASAALTPAELEDMHGRKTGALIRASVTVGAIVAGADDRSVAALDDYARELGLAFQIVDDILDVEGSDATLGKTAGKDAAAGKPTYPALHGLDESRRRATACVDRAIGALARAGASGRLGDIARWSLSRRT